MALKGSKIGIYPPQKQYQFKRQLQKIKIWECMTLPEVTMVIRGYMDQVFLNLVTNGITLQNCYRFHRSLNLCVQLEPSPAQSPVIQDAYTRLELEKCDMTVKQAILKVFGMNAHVRGYEYHIDSGVLLQHLRCLLLSSKEEGEEEEDGKEDASFSDPPQICRQMQGPGFCGSQPQAFPPIGENAGSSSNANWDAAKDSGQIQGPGFCGSQPQAFPPIGENAGSSSYSNWDGVQDSHTTINASANNTTGYDPVPQQNTNWDGVQDSHTTINASANSTTGYDPVPQQNTNWDGVQDSHTTINASANNTTGYDPVPQQNTNWDTAQHYQHTADSQETAGSYHTGNNYQECHGILSVSKELPQLNLG